MTDFDPEPPDEDAIRAVPNTPSPMAPVRDLDESGPPEDCPLCARRCPLCQHTLGTPWEPGAKVRCHNCGGDVGPAPVMAVRSSGGQND